ncbi:MAG: hypothetical protein HQM08_07490 [Candidatus Riflebacteria bacterium]|nr:hypothetical protein [Candidatus Riflebacteria bacterium]
MKRYLISCWFCLAIFVPANAWEISKTLTLGYSQEDNITMEVQKIWREKDWAFESGLNFSAGKEVDRGKRWTVSLDLKNRDFRRFSTYDQFLWNMKVSYRQKQGLGWMAPWWKLQAGFGQARFGNESIYDRNLMDFALEYGKRINMRTTLTGGFTFDASRGRFTDVLDLNGLSAGIRGQYALDSRWSLTGGFQMRNGDVAIHSWEGYYNFEPLVYLKNWGTWNWLEKTMIRIPDAHTNKWSVGLVFSATPNSSWNLVFDTIKTEKNDWSYPDKIGKIIYLLEF